MNCPIVIQVDACGFRTCGKVVDAGYHTCIEHAGEVDRVRETTSEAMAWAMGKITADVAEDVRVNTLNAVLYMLERPPYSSIIAGGEIVDSIKRSIEELRDGRKK